MTDRPEPHPEPRPKAAPKLHAVTPAEAAEATHAAQARSRLAHPSNQALDHDDPCYLELLYRLSGHQTSAEVIMFPTNPRSSAPSKPTNPTPEPDPLKHPLQAQPPAVKVAWATLTLGLSSILTAILAKRRARSASDSASDSAS